MMIIENERSEFRKVQAMTGERSLTLVLPKVFATLLGIEKGSLMRCQVRERKLIIEKAE